MMMMMMMSSKSKPIRSGRSISFRGLEPASARASLAARAASKKTGTRCELLLRRELWRRGLRYQLNSRHLPGKPDLVFRGPKVAVFCDGDFWHGRDLESRLKFLAAGHNPDYWIAKIKRNVDRDSRNTAALESLGWVVLRFWESDIIRSVSAIATYVSSVVSGGDDSVSSARAVECGISNFAAIHGGSHSPSIGAGTSPKTIASTS